MIPVLSGLRVWLAVGHTDMRRGMNRLAIQVQGLLKRDPHAGDLYVFRGNLLSQGSAQARASRPPPLHHLRFGSRHRSTQSDIPDYHEAALLMANVRDTALNRHAASRCYAEDFRARAFSTKCCCLRIAAAI
jgi:hypothetical protein